MRNTNVGLETAGFWIAFRSMSWWTRSDATCFSNEGTHSTEIT
jgi:hypothetical protein